jgi:gas vesicle protein
MNKLFLGALAGLAIGLLIAPEKGSDLREDIADNATKLKNRLNRLVGRADARLDDLRDLLEQNIDGLAEDVRHRILTILDDATEMSYSSKSKLTNGVV